MNVAAKRRLKEFKKTNKKITLKSVKQSIKLRNHVDSTRKFSPLLIPPGAVIVDTTRKNRKQVFSIISTIVKKKIKEKYG